MRSVGGGAGRGVGRRGDAIDHHVHAGGKPGSQRALQRRAEILGTLHVLAVAAERDRGQVVARRRELAAYGARGAIVLELELMLGVPARVVAHYRQHWKPRTDRRVKLEAVEAEGAVA